MTSITDASTAAMAYALRGLETRGDVRANNVANANTPGFVARHVDFESTLRAAMTTGRPDRAPEPLVVESPTIFDGTGNSVDLETELVGMMKDNLVRESMVSAYNFKVTAMRTAITGH